MVDVSGIPNMGFGGGGYFGGSSSLGLPAMSADQINASMWGGYSPYQAQSTINNLYGGGGFGSLTDYYSSLGAAYGRETGGFGGGGGGGYPGGAVERGPDLPDLSYNPFAALAPSYGGGDWASGGYMGQVFDPGIYAPAPQTFEGMWGGGYQAPQYDLPSYITEGRGYQPQMPPSPWGAPDWQSTYGQPVGDQGYDFSGGGNSFYYGQPSANPSYFDQSSYGGQSPVYQGWKDVPAYDPGSFANRFGAGGYYNPGTPSQYYTGSEYGGGGGSPPGYSGTYGVDSPGGALPLNTWGGFGQTPGGG